MLLNRNILFKSLGCLLLSLVAGGCTSDEFGEDKSKNELHNQLSLVTLNISALAQQTRSVADPSERIGYLRIVMLDEDNIEFNRLISFLSVDPIEKNDDQEDTENPEEDEDFEEAGSLSPFGDLAIDLDYLYSFPTKPGKKKFFLIGNEQSVAKVKFQFPKDFDLDSSGYEGLKKLKEESEEEGGISLSRVLTYYTKDPKQFTDEAGEFEMAINSIYFLPEYTIDNDNNIYLPYSAYYEKEVKEQMKTDAESGNRQTVEMYLVPDAVKFKFHFENYRKNPVKIKDITLTGIASTTFLMAHVEESDFNKKSFTTKKDMYWIDWLKEVADLSRDYPEYAQNVIFNGNNGWISNYKIPSFSNYPENNPDGEKTIFLEKIPVVEKYGDITAGQPSPLDIGPFYFPESFKTETEQLTDSEGNLLDKFIEVQKYHLLIEFEGTEENAIIYKPDLVIGNLNSFFRNTDVIINVSMKDWDDDGAYAEIQFWTEKTSNGYLQEDTTK